MNWTAERRLYEAYRDSSLLEVEGSKNVASGFTGVQIDFQRSTFESWKSWDLYSSAKILPIPAAHASLE